MAFSIRSDSAAIDDLAPEWIALWDKDPTASVFQRPEYVGLWFTEFGKGHPAQIVEIRDDETGALKGLAPLGVGGDGILHFLGDKDVTDYFGPLSALADREFVARALIDAIGSIPGWRHAELSGLAEDTGWDGTLAHAAKEAGLIVDVTRQDVCPRVELTGAYDDYLASLDGKLRHEIKRKARKLEREAGPYTVRLVDGEDVHDHMERFFELHRGSEGPKGHFLHWGMAGFFILLARTFAQQGWLRLTVLEQGDRALAGVFSFVSRGVWNVYNSAFDQSIRELGPGMVLMAETIRLATEERCATFDLLRGDEPYKYRFGARDVELRALSIGST